MRKTNTIHTKVATVTKDVRGFLRITFKNSTESFDLEEAKLQLSAALELMEDQIPFCILVDTSHSYVTPSVEAQQFIVEQNCKKAEAIIVRSLAYRLIGRFYLKLQRKTPSKLFKTEQEAIDWLLDYL